MVDRKCAGCGKIKNREEVIKITREKASGNIVINHSNKIFGRSAYICYNNSCVETAYKKNKIAKVLKASIPEDLKGRLLNEF